MTEGRAIGKLPELLIQLKIQKHQGLITFMEAFRGIEVVKTFIGSCSPKIKSNDMLNLKQKLIRSINQNLMGGKKVTDQSKAIEGL